MAARRRLTALTPLLAALTACSALPACPDPAEAERAFHACIRTAPHPSRCLQEARDMTAARRPADMAGQKPTDADVRIGARIHEARKAARMTQRAVSKALGFTAAQLQKYEAGTNRISASTLQEVAEILGVPLLSLFDPPRAGDTGSVDRSPELVHAIIAVVQDFERRGRPQLAKAA